MYEDLLDEIAQQFPHASLLDVACNNGYIPVGAELRGMRGAGMDLGDYGASVAFLNKCLGTGARFFHQWYDSRIHAFPSDIKYDVVVMMAIMCHIPDPLHFLAAAANRAEKAFLFWGANRRDRRASCLLPTTAPKSLFFEGLSSMLQR